uniref:Cytochrome-b5 reductase n=2 Tax=Naja naja TaxID=35670 RepID=A0A8C6XPN4_NAJNA
SIQTELSCSMSYLLRMCPDVIPDACLLCNSSCPWSSFSSNEKAACSAFQAAAFVTRTIQDLQELLEIQIKIPSLDLRSFSHFFSFRGVVNGFFEVLIKCYKTGLMSQYIKSWKTGDTIFWRGPFGGFPYTANQYGELLMLASGTGIAPMLPIIQYITENEDDETFVTLIGCFRTFENIYMKALLQEQSRFWNIRTFYVLSQEQSLKNLPWSFRETVHLGRINENLIKSMVNTCRRKPFVLVCGSVTFNEDMEKCLKAIGFEKESYFIF